MFQVSLKAKKKDYIIFQEPLNLRKITPDTKNTLIIFLSVIAVTQMIF